MDFERVDNVKLSEKVINQFESMLNSGKLKPGDRLPAERQLAEKLGVSRGILREALRALENRGYISRVPGGGTRVRELSDRQSSTQRLVEALKHASYLDLLEVRETLEQRIVELAVERASEEQLAEMEILLSASNGEPPTALDRAFHLGLARTTGNVVMINFIEANLSLIRDITLRTHSNPHRSQEVRKEHQRILQAVKERNATKAREAMLAHLRSVRAAVEAIFDQERVD